MAPSAADMPKLAANMAAQMTALQRTAFLRVSNGSAAVF